MLQREGYSVLLAGNGQEAIDHLASAKEIHAIVTDLRMPRVDGMEVLRRASQDYPDVPVIVLTAHGSVDSAVTAVKLGAFDYIEKPFDQEQIQQIIAKAVRTHALRQSQVRLGGVSSGKGRYGLVGSSDLMQQVYNVIEKVTDTPSTVLITGESGTGKELVAKALHEFGPRREAALIKVNCAAIPDTLIESELFGYEKGAFTGAVNAKPGRFELADKGTLFLDEIGEIPLEMQVKLLRALQENEFERVGGINTIKVDVRVVAATNRDLVKLIQEGGFREDLYYRLNVVPIEVPPLRQRRSDLRDLVSHIIEKFRERLGKDIKGVEPQALDALIAYDWPGNIRELENVLERTILFCEGPQIGVGDLPDVIRGGVPQTVAASSALPDEGASLKDAVRAETERVERQMILAALDETGGNVTHAAKKLQISRKSLQNKMKELGLRDATEG